jgi:hypothetical protein
MDGAALLRRKIKSIAAVGLHLRPRTAAYFSSDGELFM